MLEIDRERSLKAGICTHPQVLLWHEASGVVLPRNRARESLRMALHQWRRSDVLGVPTASFILHRSSGVFRSGVFRRSLSHPVKKCCVTLLREGGGADMKVLPQRHRRRSESDARGFGRMRKGLLPRQQGSVRRATEELAARWALGGLWGCLTG